MCRVPGGRQENPWEPLSCFLSPLRGWLIFHLATHGLRRGLHSFAASRLDRAVLLPGHFFEPL